MCAKKCLLEVALIGLLLHILGPNPQKHFEGVNRHIRVKRTKYLHFCITKIIGSIPSNFRHIVYKEAA